MIFWFTGQPGHGKTTLAIDFMEMIESVSISRKKGILVDGDDLREIFQNKDYSKEGRIKNIIFAQNLAHFLNNKGFNVFATLVTPYKDIREEFKKRMGKNITEIYVHTTDIRGREHFHVNEYEPPLNDYIDIDTTNKTIKESRIALYNLYIKIQNEKEHIFL